MEKEKYYAPTIEEFYIGFEFEHFYINKWQTVNDFDNHFITDDTNTLSEVRWELGHGKIRVKYLDREDIESFGFELETNININGGIYDFVKKVIYMEEETICNIHLVKSYVKISIIFDGIEVLFSGNIKNKSEFSRLLKQLSII